ncbi:MAG: hypothetical protein KGY74_05250 [Candidatus Cloacimonetes bacterium]|nr:hypothetical protein [Candidatus Cloacimonadota bacterium]
MKVPIGFEFGTKCQLQINIGSASQPNRKNFNFFHYGSNVKAIEIGHFFKNVNNDNVKITTAYHLEFDLKLIDKNYFADNQNQDYLTKFLKYYYDPTITWQNHNENFCFNLYFYLPTSSYYYSDMAKIVITKKAPEIINIYENDKKIGQYLEIKAITKNKLTPIQNQKFWSLYRETAGSQQWGNWTSGILSWESFEVGQVSSV